MTGEKNRIEQIAAVTLLGFPARRLLRGAATCGARSAA
jgi:hypothetical protein